MKDDKELDELLNSIGRFLKIMLILSCTLSGLMLVFLSFCIYLLLLIWRG